MFAAAASLIILYYVQIWFDVVLPLFALQLKYLFQNFIVSLYSFTSNFLIKFPIFLDLPQFLPINSFLVYNNFFATKRNKERSRTKEIKKRKNNIVKIKEVARAIKFECS